MRQRMIFMQTHSGKRVDLVFPQKETIDIKDIAYSLSMKCRFNGHTKEFYSVSQHCVLVSKITPDNFKLAALLHDANEAYLPDVPSPVKSLLPQYTKLEDFIQDAIDEIFGIRLTPLGKLIVKKSDQILLATEGRDLMGDTEGWALMESPLPDKIKPLNSKDSESLFLKTYNELI